VTIAAQTVSAPAKQKRIPVLDGWRGISILLVLVGHMLPLGPKWMELNSAVSTAGLSVFFFLSGFLVASMLLRNDNVVSFFVRRVFRILPLAWLALVILLVVEAPSGPVWIANLLFYANIPADTLLRHGEHLWSLSVEMQFYLAVGLSVAIFGKRALILLPLACIGVTLGRVAFAEPYSIVTWFRVDEILVGGTTAVLMHRFGDAAAGRKWPMAVSLILMVALFLSSHPYLSSWSYFRPYITATLVFSTFEQDEGLLKRVLSSKSLKYLAEISYALYVVHPLTYAGWMGEGDVAVKYSKRIVSVILTFAAAHLSSRYYERYFNNRGHALAARIEAGNAVKLEPQPAGER
jgi:peptidoglycan/LPS O-acetylase OafA/YrhL